MDSSLDEIFLNNIPLMDVRAPCEFERGAFPTSTNLPILTNEEREIIGKHYKNHGQQSAIELGHKLLTGVVRKPRIASWLQFAHANPHGYLYCFRGGKRSQIAQQWLSDSNMNFPLIPGGYKAMRAFLLEKLDHFANTLPFTLISGKTGSGKTQLLPKLPCYIDLEGLAAHRGSSFGATLSPQPSIISFENSLAIAMLQSAHTNPRQVYLEDEGKLIGRVSIPLSLRDRMLKLEAVLLIESIEKRVAVSEKDYIIDLLESYQTTYGEQQGLALFTDHHLIALGKIRKRFGNENTKQSEQLFQNGVNTYTQQGRTSGFQHYIEHLLTKYYDPMYEYQFESKNRKVIFEGCAAEVQQWCNYIDGRGRQ